MVSGQADGRAPIMRVHALSAGSQPAHLLCYRDRRGSTAAIVREGTQPARRI